MDEWRPVGKALLKAIFTTAGQRLLAGAVESGSRGTYLTGLSRFREFLLASNVHSVED